MAREIIAINELDDNGVISSEVLLADLDGAHGVRLEGTTPAQLAAMPEAAALVAIAAVEWKPPRAPAAGPHPLIGKTIP